MNDAAYRDAILQSRCDRSRRALFLAKLVGLLLMIMVGATLRSEPALRNALLFAAMDAVRPASEDHARPDAATQTRPAIARSSGFEDRIKVNRFATPTDPAQQTRKDADDLGRALANRRVGG